MEENKRNCQDEEINFKDLWQIIKKRGLGILLIFIIIVAIAYLITLLTPKVYQSSSAYYIKKIESSMKLSETDKSIIKIITYPVVLEEISQKLSLKNKIIKITPHNFKILIDDNLMEIKGFGSSPEQAKMINELISDYAINYQKEVTNYSVNVLFAPDLSDKPISPNEKLNLVIGATLGLFAGFSWVFIAEFLQKSKNKI